MMLLAWLRPMDLAPFGGMTRIRFKGFQTTSLSGLSRNRIGAPAYWPGMISAQG